MNTPLFDMIKEYAERDMTRAHTPGHSGKGGLPKEYRDFMKYDLTEIKGLDELYRPNGVILKAENLCKDVFGSGATLFSAGGCTLAIQTMLSLAASDGDTVVCARNVHAGVLNACAFIGADVRFVLPDENDDFRINAADIENALINTNAKAVILTSPNYYGALSDIKSISNFCRRHGAKLLVDNAHGTHLIKFGLHPITLGADMSADSAHKTLPVLTGGAYLQIKDGALYRKAKSNMSVFGSTSPSYPIMASLDIARDFLKSDESDKLFFALKDRVQKLKLAAHKNGIRTVGGLCDPTRLTLDLGKNAEKYADIFRRNGVEPELCDGRYIVLILTVFHDERDFKRIESAIGECECAGTPKYDMFTLPKRTMSLRQAMFSESETVDISKAIGRISAENTFCCPPGTASVVCGEIIDENAINRLILSGKSSVSVVKE